VADTYGWRDTTSHYPDPDCDLTQRFVRGEIIVVITWFGTGTHKFVKSLEVRADAPMLSYRDDDLLYYDQSPGIELGQVLGALVKSYYPADQRLVPELGR
jgi:hypothetical protein